MTSLSESDRVKQRWASYFEIPDDELQELMSCLAGTLRNIKQNLQNHFERVDFEALAREAHALKEVSGPDLESLRDLASKLEGHAKERNPIATGYLIDGIVKSIDFSLSQFPA